MMDTWFGPLGRVGPEKEYADVHARVRPKGRAPSPMPPALEPVMTAVPDLALGLKAIPGIDLEAGLALMHGRHETLLRFLGKFCEVHQQDGSALRAHLAASALPEAIRLVHSLKGAAGTLGLVGLQTRAARIEDALRAGSLPSDPALDDLETTLASTCQAIVATALKAGG